MKEVIPHTPLTRREALITGAGALAATGTALYAPAVIGQAKPFDGTTINAGCWSATYPKLVAQYLPEFEEQTGIKVNLDIQSFPIFNQRADLELSTGGSSYDVLNLTFIYIARWLNAGWFTPLDDFIADPNKTPADWDAADFLEAPVRTLSDHSGTVYAIPWTADAQMACATRWDILQAAGHGMAENMEELERVIKDIDGKDGVSGFITENVYHWTWMPFLQGYGGGVFVDPPDNLMPTLNTPEAVESAEFFVKLLMEYGPDGVLSYGADATIGSLRAGRSNYTILNHAYVVPFGRDPNIGKTVHYGQVPAGPAGRKAQVAVHGWGIPTGARNKDAAWEFIKWSLSRPLLQQMLAADGYAALTRKSTIASPAFKEAMTVNGQDLGQLYLDIVEQSKDGHMAYRTVHVFPQAGQQINKAIEKIATQQMSAQAALDEAQTNLIADLRKAGVEL